MNTLKTNRKTDMKVMLSTLWIFAMLNYLYADVMSLMNPDTFKAIMSGYIGSVEITEGFLLGAAILMETAIVMVFLSRVLKYRANRLANIIAGMIHTAAVSLSMFVGEGPELYYIFFGTIEIACTVYIVFLAWRWSDPEKVK